MKVSIRQNTENKIGQLLTDEEFDLFQSLLSKISLKKKEFLIREGDLNSNIYFIENGILHSFKTDESGEMHSIQFGFPGHWISDLYSFFSGNHALFSVEALEDAELLVLNYSGFKDACEKLPKFEKFFRILIQNAYVKAQQRIAKNFSNDAAQRYKDLLEQQPEMLQKVPQYLVASYLGIKPQSLSRIRKEITGK
jgi:CRP-like cAMP-binding protein